MYLERCDITRAPLELKVVAIFQSTVNERFPLFPVPSAGGGTSIDYVASDTACSKGSVRTASVRRINSASHALARDSMTA